jgi:hypothetical protein
LRSTSGSDIIHVFLGKNDTDNAGDGTATEQGCST